MKVAIYIRVSTIEQAEEGFSIAAQKERLLAYCTSQGWEITEIYIDDGKSAKDTNRPQLQRMLSDIENKEIDVVLVYKLDRLTRSVLDLYQLLEVFEKHNVKFKSATEVYDTTTAIGRLFLTLVAALAQWYRENLSENVSFGMAEKVRQGQWHGSDAPYGYDYIVDEKKLVINEKEAEVVRNIFNMYIDGYSDRKIAIKLNEDGIPTQKGGPWRENRIRYMLTNPIYIGNLRWGVRINQNEAFEVENAAPSIISKETFDNAQKIRHSRRRFHGRQATSDFIFSGVLRCVRCGGPLKGHTKREKGRRYKSYRCINSLENHCDFGLISERTVEYNFIEYLKKMSFDVEIEINNNDNAEENEKLIKKLNKDLSSISSRKKKWQYAWANEMIDDDQFTERMKEENEKENQIKQRLKDLEVNIEDKIIDTELKEMVTNTIDRWDSLHNTEKKQIVSILIDKIVIDKINTKKLLDRVKILEMTLN